MTSQTPPTKIVVFTSRLSYSVLKGIVAIDNALPGLSWLVLLSSPKRSLSGIAKNQWRNLRRNGWRWLPYQAADLVERVVARLGSADAVPEDPYSATALTARPNVRLLECADLHAPDTLEVVKAFAPDLGISLAAPILPQPLFSIPRLGTINLHKGKLPDYRGMPPAFWELWNDEPTVGCTVHWVDSGLDTGSVAAEATVPRGRFSTLRALQLQLDEVGVELMRDTVRDVLGGTPRRSPQRSGGRTYRKPTLQQVAALRKKLGTKSSAKPGGPKELVKYSAGKAAPALWKLGARHAVAPRITVLLYHRVSDEVRDNLTVGIEQFDRQMEFVRSQCEPLALEKVIERDVIPRTRKPLVCVTFDDGYLDNYASAAPILLRHRVPAAFFVSTGIVGTQGRFPHDVLRKNPPIPVMEWDHLRNMHRQGFTIGSHSMTHIDCAAESAETVWRELTGSMTDLRRELGLSEVLFAYPYGGRQHMTPERLELVKKAGYSACLSAYGGTNVRRVDPFNVLRRSIHWQFSDEAFTLECIGLT